MKRFALMASCAATPALADSDGYPGMMDRGYGHDFGLMFGPVLWLVVLGLVVAGVIWFVRSLESQQGRKKSAGAIAELDMRFARGEIDAEDYAARKKLLGS